MMADVGFGMLDVSPKDPFGDVRCQIFFGARNKYNWEIFF